ncbi:DUF4435 domain-containing protein [Pseudoalteromonas issachenkonii]|uniref:DUF4435 domain-containing protein n=1 Tax=Pseudoalteromonas issachenkonii TaxID=152297 RepID=A0ABU9H1T6_9GAMM
MATIEKGSSFSIDSIDIEIETVFTDKREILVYVESFEDIPFWLRAFKKAGIEGCKIVEISSDHTTNGKSSILSKIRAEKVKLGKFLLIAVDSDYDYLKDQNQDILSSEFCFQTYCYSIENYIYYPYDLTEQCSIASNCIEFLSPQDCFGETLKDWSLSIAPEYLNFLRDDCLESIAKATNSLNNLQEIESPDIDIDIDIEPCYLDKGLTAENLYLFIRGHDLEEAMVNSCEAYTDKILQLKKDKINNSPLADKVKGQRIGEFLNARTHFKNILKHRDFSHIPFYENIISEIKEFERNTFK